MKIIPAIDLIDGKSVRLSQGDYNKQVDMPMTVEEAVAFYSQFPQVSRIHVVDLIGAKEKEAMEVSTISKIKALTKLPLELGGGLRNLETIASYDKLGIDYFILGSKAVTDVDWLRQVVNKYPGRVYVGLDCKGEDIYINGWKENSGRQLIDFVKEIEELDLAGIIYTDIYKDGMQQGPNVERTGQLQGQTRHKIIASGGVRHREDLDALEAVGIQEAIVGKAAQDPAFWKGLKL